MRFRAELEATGRNTAGFEVPEEVVEALGGGKHPKVAVTVNGFGFRTSIARMGGRYLLGMSAERRSDAGVAPGEVLDVDVELDTAPRELDVPQDLADALAASPEAAALWDTLSYSQKQWHVLQVTGTKNPDTRAARVERSIARLREGHAR